MIRKATLDDIPAIMAMAGTVFPTTYREILSPEQLEFMMDWMYSEENLRRQMLERGDVFLVEDGKGYASFRPDGFVEGTLRERYHLEKLYVLPQWQKTGLGRRLFDAVVAEVGTGVRLELNVNRNNPAVSFYEHIGMRRDRSGDFPIGHGYFMNDYIMAIDL